MRGDQLELLVTDQTADEMDAYERLLGDATPVHEYEPNTWGPTEADALICRQSGLAQPDWLNRMHVPAMWRKRS